MVVGTNEEGEARAVDAWSEQDERTRTQKWWRDATANAVSAPMTVHSSIDGGLLQDRWVGVLGLMAGGIGFKKAWRDTA